MHTAGVEPPRTESEAPCTGPTPRLVLHPLPQLGGHLVEADVEGWEERGLMK